MRRLSLALAVLCVGLAAASAFAATGSKLTGSLARSGEVTGFVAETPKASTSARRYLVAGGAHGKTLRRYTARLTKEKFVAGATEWLDPAPGTPSDSGGVSWAVRFGSSRGAKEEKAHLLKHAKTEGGTIRFFDVPGLPGARVYSFTDSDPHKLGGAANVVWTHGACAFLVGDSLPTGSKDNQAPFVDPVITGAKAIVARTQGACPRR